MTGRAGEQAAVQAGRPRRSSRAAQKAAADLPVARVAVDMPLPHLDRLFDYLVPEPLADSAVPGCRVKVRFSGRLTGGYVVERAAVTEHAGRLAFLHRVVSPEPVLTPELAGLARAVADRYGGTLADVLRLAIPPRHAAAEAAAAWPSPVAADPPGGTGQWARYPAGPSFLAAIAAGRAPRAVWSALPGPCWPGEIALAVAAAAGAGRGALVIVPDARDLALADGALAAQLGPHSHVTLSAQLGPAERYRRWLAAARGQVRVVAGTRSAMFAPVTDLGLVVIWDDGDDLHAEQRAPYPHARDVLLLRAHRSGAAALIGGFAMTAEAAQLAALGWARELAADSGTIRRHAPLVLTADEDAELARDEAARTARIPGIALRTAREGLAAGPVLVQVPRRGYLAAVACQRCRARARCPQCGGQLALTGPGQPLNCRWCGFAAEPSCANCGSTGLRALVSGASRTAEELSRAFPDVPVRTSAGPGVIAEVAETSAIVIATPGAEPRAAGGYAACVLLDGWALLGRASLRAAEEALRRWMNAAALVRPRTRGGKVVVVADQAVSAVQALIRWDAAGHASRELAERAELGFPPAMRMAALTGQEPAVCELIGRAALPPGAGILGPVAAQPDGASPGTGQAPDNVRFLVRVPWSEGTALAVALRARLAERSARKEAGTIRLQLDPAELI